MEAPPREQAFREKGTVKGLLKKPGRETRLEKEMTKREGFLQVHAGKRKTVWKGSRGEKKMRMGTVQKERKDSKNKTRFLEKGQTTSTKGGFLNRTRV